MGIKIKVPVVKEATCLGAAILAGYGVGIYKDVNDTAKSLVKWDKEYIPNNENHIKYNEVYEKWKKVYFKQLELSDEKITKHMWIAPGL